LNYARAMRNELDRVWVAEVCGVCDPVFAAADVGFERQVHEEPDRGITALLWEAEPERFAARYPDSGISESYGDQWFQVTCIDFWVYLDGAPGQARTSTEGWSADQDTTLALTGDGFRDGLKIGTVMARILRVPAPKG
jgi:hypothetical protein